jgi:ElaB/YqjD/DUF883 family membrane-anchored ribosome-binding protein
MDSARERLALDVKSLLADVDSLFTDAGAATGEEARALRTRAESALQKVRARFDALQDDIVHRGKATDAWVHENPWSSVGLGASVGLLVGFLIARR